MNNSSSKPDWKDSDIKSSLTEKFVRYAKIWTTSDRKSDKVPSTENQWDLLRLIEKELNDLGLSVFTDPNGYIIATLKASSEEMEKIPVIGFMAHVDTAEDSPGKDVKPQFHDNYDGKKIVLNSEFTLDPVENPDLLKYQGETVITSDGSTLLGADDKAGLAEIITAVEYLVHHPEISHGPIEVVVTSDEETGRGMDNFPYDKIKSVCCYTMDGGNEGDIETECFNAFKADIFLTGKSIHPGNAKNKLVNAISMTAAYVSLLPRNESPEATEGRDGFYLLHGMEAEIEKGWIEIYLRDFDYATVQRRCETLKDFAKAIEASYPGGTVQVKIQKQYLNMLESYKDKPELVEIALDAVRDTGIEPSVKMIRGGTDGARLAEMGVPAPNIFTGGHNYHSRTEWVAVPAMIRASKVILNIIKRWTGLRKSL